MRWRYLALREAIHLTIILGSVVLLHRTVSAFEVEGASMEPTLHPHQYVVVDTLAPSIRIPRRGEVIIFRYPRNPSVEYVKRVIGLPGEVISIARGHVYVNNQTLDEPYIRDQPRYFWGPAAVPAKSLFVLGDNRNSSSDSHLWGAVPFGNVIGRAWLAYRPFAGWTWLAGQAPHLAASAG